MIFEHYSKVKKTLLIISALLIAAGVVYLTVMKLQSDERGYTDLPGAVFCTEEAMMCPDGSYVGRIGPECQFSPCPDEAKKEPGDDPRMDYTAIILDAPSELPTDYISAVDWPPTAQVLTEPFVCTEGGEEIAQGGKTEEMIIGGNSYCVTRGSEGAAGSVYTQYAYAFLKDGRKIIMTFTMRFVQCYNYDEPQKSACAAEQASFDINYLAHTIAQTAKWAAALPATNASGI